jgi:hypothetical protein
LQTYNFIISFILREFIFNFRKYLIGDLSTTYSFNWIKDKI